MGTYRKSRALEASIIDFLDTELSASFSGISVEKTFSRIYSISLPSVCVRVGDTTFTKAEIGGESLIRDAQLLIDIFGTSFGNTLDIKDFIIDKLKSGCIYYDFVISGGTVQSKTANGRVRFLDLSDSAVNFEQDRDRLDVHDRFRWLINCRVSLGRIE